MARMPDATWRPLSINHSKGGNRPRVVILHIIVGTLASADSWFRNSRSKVSAHFGTGRDGRIYQWVDTADRAWANAGANSYAVSIENEGQVGDALTPAQVEACARILAWASKTHGITIQVNNSVAGSGLSYHNMSSSWSLGGTACPGPRIVAQRPQIVARALQIAGGGAPAPSQEDDMPDRRYLSTTAGTKLRRGEWTQIKLGEPDEWSLAGVSSRPQIFTAETGWRIEGLSPGDEYQVRLCSYDPPTGGGSWREATGRRISEHRHKDGDAWDSRTFVGQVSAAQRVRVQIKQWTSDDARVVSTNSDVLTWDQ